MTLPKRPCRHDGALFARASRSRQKTKALVCGRCGAELRWWEEAEEITRAREGDRGDSG